MTKKLKYILLLALFCSTNPPAQAGFNNSFLYKLSTTRGVSWIFKRPSDIKEDVRLMRTNRTIVDAKKEFAHAVAYVEKELKIAGIDPECHIVINGTMQNAAAYRVFLKLPLSVLENPETQRALNQAKCVVAHEIEHLRLRQYPWIDEQLCSSFQGARLREYQADGAAIKKFKREPQALLDMAIEYMDEHQKAAISRQIAASNDVHDSDLSRANRLIIAARLPCNEQLLARILEHRRTEHLSKDRKAKKIDTSPIIEILKQPREKIIADYGIDPGLSPEEQAKGLDLIEIPYPLQTYGQ